MEMDQLLLTKPLLSFQTFTRFVAGGSPARVLKVIK